MIVSRLDSADGYAEKVFGMPEALDFLRRPDLAALPDGRYELPGGLFATVQRYSTAAAPEGGPRFEAHRKYTDIQFIVSGAEVIGVAPLKAMKVEEEYDEARDICFGAVAAGAWRPVELAAGSLAVLGPSDAHAPKMAAGAPAPVLKVVVKIPA